MKLIDILKYVLLGVIQGFTEPLPISSSGHLFIFKKLFNLNVLNDLNFEIIVNFGSLIAILILYREKLIKLIKEFFLYIKTSKKEYKESFKYCLLIVVATIPAGICGILFKAVIEEYFSSIKYVGVALLVTALFLFLVRNINGSKSDKDITLKDAIIIGLCQAVALLPGISRSGSTLVGGLKQDLKKDTAIDFSFMLYIPISIATMILGISDIIRTPNIKTYLLPYFLGMISSLVVTYFTFRLFKDLVRKNKMIYFVIYCLIVGTLVLLFL